MSIMVIAGTIAGACLGSYALVKVTWENLGSGKKRPLRSLVVDDFVGL
jgi:hypothetical protein